MWFFSRTKRDCRAFEAALEDYLDAGPGGRPSAVLAAHLSACPECREALDAAQEVSAMVRHSAIPVPAGLAGDPYFATRVAARIRANASHAGEFWPQLESASLRMMAYALSVAILLGALSASGITRTGPPSEARLRPADPHAISPEVNPAPMNPDEVVMALLGSDQGRQR
ncbi:MAG TPA: zf-HC2 domain-containing protein [Candidatus Acidoferrales bacterium]|nr:zf-HC2 domain-containing protein [Candidatus Acidoferrales bacterium]